METYRFRNILMSGAAMMMLMLPTASEAQQLHFKEKKMQPVTAQAPDAPDNEWVTDYKGSSFKLNWSMSPGATSYSVNLFRLNYDDTRSFFEDFKNVNHTDGLIDIDNPGFPEGWDIDVSSNGYTDMAFDGKEDHLLMDANGDHIKSPLFEGYLTEAKCDMNLVNIPDGVDLTEDNTAIIVFRLYNDKNFCVHEGAISALIFADMQKVDIFKDLFRYVPPMRSAIEFTIVKDQDHMFGDIMVNSVSFSYAPNDYILKDKNTGSARTLDVTGTDVNTIYYSNVSALKGNSASTPSTTLMIDMVMTPEAKVTDVTDHSYTVAWNAVPRADFYDITNYNIVKVEKDGMTDILHEDFSNIKEGTFDDPISIPNPDEYTAVKGWKGNRMVGAEGMFGGDNKALGGQFSPGFVQSPVIDLSGDGGKYTIHLKAYGTPGDYLSVYRVGYVVDNKLNIHATQKFPEDGYIDESWTMDDGAADMYLSFEPKNMKRFFIDEITISQNRKAGEIIKQGIESNVLLENPDQLTYTFDNLMPDTEYGYEMMSIHKDDFGNGICSEKTSLEVIVINASGIEENIADGISIAASNGVISVTLSESAEVALFSLDGRCIASGHCGIGTSSFGVSDDICILKVGSRTFKVMVR